MIGVSVPALHKVFTGNEQLVEMFSLVMNNNISHNPYTIVAGAMSVPSRSNLYYRQRTAWRY